MSDVEESRDKVMMGAERRSKVISDEDKKLTAYHEAGHARYKYRHPYERSEVTSAPDNYPIMWLSMVPENSTLEEFIKDKNDFFKRDWEGVRYFNCTDN